MAPRWQTLLDEPDEEAVASDAPDMIIEETIDVPVDEAPLGRTLSMDEVRATTPEAPPGTDWLRGLMAGTDDPTGFGAVQMTTDDLRETAEHMPGSLNAMAAGGVHGTAMGLERLIPSVREWSVDAEREEPTAFAGGDLLASALPFNPINKLGTVTRAIPAATRTGAAIRALADVGVQGALGAVDSAARQYGDTGEVDGPDLTAGGISAALSVPGALAGAAGARGAARAATPEAQATRAIDYRNARLRSAGIDPSNLRGMSPEEEARLLTDVEALAAQGGSGLTSAATVQQMNQRARDTAAAAGTEKDAALAALAAQGASVDQGVIANNLLEQQRSGAGPATEDYNTLISGVANRYDPPYQLDGFDAPSPAPVATPVAPSQPPPLPAAASQPPPLPMSIAGQDLTPVRPAARFNRAPEAMPGPSVAQGPQATTPPVEQPSAMPSNGPPLPGIADPVGALAAQPYLYHSTPAENLPEIQRRGLLPRAQQRVPGKSPYVEDDIRAQALHEKLLAEGRLPPGVPTVREPYEDGVWFSGEAERAEWDRTLAEDSDGAGFATLRTQAPAQFRPASGGRGGDEYFRSEPVYPSQLEMQGPDGSWNRLAPPGGTPPPLPPTEQFVDGVPVGEPITATREGIPIAEWNLPEEQFFDAYPVAGGPRSPMSVDDFANEQELVGRKVSSKAVPTPEDDIKSERYAALMDAARQGFGEVDPTATAAWDAANSQQGRMLDIAEMGAPTANAPPAPFIRALGGLGPAAALGSTALAGVNPALAAVGAGAGYAAGRWITPRTNSLRAEWLSKDTGAMLDRVSGLGQKPVGSMVSSFGDLMRNPPPSAPEPDNDPASDETSSLDPGSFLGRNTTQAMMQNPDAFMPYAPDYQKAGTDDKRAAVTERLYRTDPAFAKNVFPRIRSSENA